MDHQSQGLNEGLSEYSNSADHWSNGLNNKGRRDQSCHATHQSRGLDRGLRVCSGQTDHQSNRPNENSGEQYGQTDYRSTGPDKGSKCYSGVLAHRSTRPDNSSGEHLCPQDQQNSIKANKKFSSHRGLNMEISTDSQTSDQDCDTIDRLYLCSSGFLRHFLEKCPHWFTRQLLASFGVSFCVFWVFVILSGRGCLFLFSLFFFDFKGLPGRPS